MSEREFFVEDRRIGEIVDCITTSNREQAERVLARFIDAEHLRLNERPSPTLLERYEYWSERP